MKFNHLGNTDIKVSEICLGSMNWGTQNSEAEGHQQMDYALDHGVNFFDTAEMYPANPISAETQGRTEEIIGSWFKSSARREQVVLATKVTGEGLKWVQDGTPISPEKIRISVEGSLQRLNTDFIDLYQLHWPNRGSYHFRQAWRFDPTSQDKQETRSHILEILVTLKQLIDQGKIRQIGLSNESCWGTAQFLQIADLYDLPRVASIQNEYSLLYRSFDLDLAELAHNEQVGLLPYSPLACGMLSGKYQGGVKPAGSRITINPSLYGRVNEQAIAATAAYVEVAQKHHLDAAQMALAFCRQRAFVTSTIIAATSLEQLATNIGSCELELGKEVLDDIHEVYRRYPAPI